ncbi:MAG: hypothetical protein J6R80_01390 [Kiritimatiellae bacterium]|jgi:hypothetical protein|nr:hypothetical protein [Kiritimatiellia bacterium]
MIAKFAAFVQKISCIACLLAFAAGCQSYEIVQRNIFSDEDGNIVSVDYGRSDTDHVNTFVAPLTGKEMEFRSKLMVRAELPDGEKFTAWQCMNFLRRGTMYKTDNERWMLLANGFSCSVFRKDEESDGGYLEVYRGVLCDTPDIGRKSSDASKWKTLPPGGRQYKPRERDERLQNKR